MLITLIVTVIIRRFYAGVNPQRFLAPKIAQLNGSFITLSAFFTYENGDSHTFVDHGEGAEPASVAASECRFCQRGLASPGTPFPFRPWGQRLSVAVFRRQ